MKDLIEIALSQMQGFAEMKTGLMPRSEYFGQADQFGEPRNFNEMREMRLAKLIASEVIRDEPRWLDYEFEQTHIMVDLTDMIFEELTEETVRLLDSL